MDQNNRLSRGQGLSRQPQRCRPAGTYAEGREIGVWKECDRFGRCKQKEYPANYPEETRRPGFKPEIPVAFVKSKYLFDFACRSTWVTQTEGGKPVVELNIGGFDPSTRHLPASFTEHGGEGSYTCNVPYSVGKRELGSLDLMNEFPKLGLPEFCIKPDLTTGPGVVSVNPSHGEGLAQVFT